MNLSANSACSYGRGQQLRSVEDDRQLSLNNGALGILTVTATSSKEEQHQPHAAVTTYRRGQEDRRHAFTHFRGISGVMDGLEGLWVLPLSEITQKPKPERTFLP